MSDAALRELRELMDDDSPWKLDGYHAEDTYSMAVSAMRQLEPVVRALRDLRQVVKEDLLPICQEHGGAVWLAEAFRIESVFAEVDDALSAVDPPVGDPLPGPARVYEYEFPEGRVRLNWHGHEDPPESFVAALGQLRAVVMEAEEKDWVPTEKPHYCNRAGPMGGGCPDSWHVGGNYGSSVCRNPNHHDGTAGLEGTDG